MKKNCIVIILSIAIIFSSCQATPEKRVIASKGQEQVKAIIENASGNISDIMQPLQYEVPQTFVSSFEGTNHNGVKMHIALDAKVTLPEYTIPLTIVKPRNLTLEQITTLINVFCEDNLLYYSQFKEYAATKKQIQSEIDMYLWEINEMKDDSQMKDFVKYRQSQIQNLYKEMSNAPDNYAAFAELIRTDQKLQDQLSERYNNRKKYSEEEIIKITSPVVITEENYTESFGKLYIGESGFAPSITIMQNSDWSGAQFSYNSNIPMSSNDWSKYVSVGRRDMVLKDELAITIDEAKSVARKYVDLVDASFEMCDSGVLVVKDYDTGIESAAGYELIYSRAYNGATINFYVERFIKASRDKDTSYELTYKLFYPQEVIIVRMDDEGKLMDFSYSSPSKEVQVVSNEVDLLGFENIMDIFQKYVVMHEFAEGTTDVFININEIKLGMMRIDMPNSDEYMVVPVWDFYGCVTYKYKYTYENGQIQIQDSTITRTNEFLTGNTVLTINAIDGSIINRELGY